jgi:AcrR family transcriptional regulator
MPRIVDKEERRRQIALKSIDLFAAQGFEKTPVSQVAEAAGVGKGTIYDYFDSKEELFSEAIVAWVALLDQEARRRLEGVVDPEERLRQLCRVAMEPFLHDERTVRIAIEMFQMLLSDSGRRPARDLVRRAFRGFRQAVVDTLLDGVASGAFRPGIARDAEKIATNLTAYLDGVGLHYYMGERFFDLMEQVDFHVEHLLPGLRAASKETR